jgi:hypothetical protein
MKVAVRFMAILSSFMKVAVRFQTNLPETDEGAGAFYGHSVRLHDGAFPDQSARDE